MAEQPGFLSAALLRPYPDDELAELHRLNISRSATERQLTTQIELGCELVDTYYEVSSKSV